jgi:phosphate transport system protein
MPNLLQNEIGRLGKRLLELGGRAEESLHLAVRALLERDRQLARQVIDADTAIDAMEVGLEEDVLGTLALHRPVAGDLRFVVSVLKISNDLERVGDLATSIARQALVVADGPDTPVPVDLRTMAPQVSAMLREALDALVRADAAQALRVRDADRDVDARHRANAECTERAIESDWSGTHYYLAYLSASRSLERIADHAKNIADDVAYVVGGEVVRHPALRGQPPPNAGGPSQ